MYVHIGKLKGLEYKGCSNISKLQDVIIYWKEQYADGATWSTLIEAIKGPIFRDPATALKIRKDILMSAQKS